MERAKSHGYRRNYGRVGWPDPKELLPRTSLCDDRCRRGPLPRTHFKRNWMRHLMASRRGGINRRKGSSKKTRPDWPTRKDDAVSSDAIGRKRRPRMDRARYQRRFPRFRRQDHLDVCPRSHGARASARTWKRFRHRGVADLISAGPMRFCEEVADMQNRPWGWSNPLISRRALRVKIRDEGF